MALRQQNRQGGNGLSRDFARKFYHSRPWKDTRDAYMGHPVERSGGICPPGMCERCFDSGRLVPAEIVHHKTHLTPENIDDPAVSLGFGNLERLCRACHAAEHPEVYGWDVSHAPRVAFDEYGNVVMR